MVTLAIVGHSLLESHHLSSSPTNAQKRWWGAYRKIKRHIASSKSNLLPLKIGYKLETIIFNIGQENLHFYPDALREYWIEWENRLSSKLTFKRYFELLFPFLPYKEQGEIFNNVVSYLDGETLESCLTTINKEGVLSQNGRPLSLGKHLFVLTQDDKLYTRIKDKGMLYKHSSFTHGNPIKSAGYFYVMPVGKICCMYNRSGHYGPQKPHIIAILNHIKQFSDIDNIGLIFHRKSTEFRGEGHVFNAKIWLREAQ